MLPKHTKTTNRASKGKATTRELNYSATRTTTKQETTTHTS
jgi:hypothetical protein